MAEFVELKLEEMLPELEQMQRVQLFTEEEIRYVFQQKISTEYYLLTLCCSFACTLRAIIKKRRDFEYKLQKHTKCKEDYLKYIQYEINLLTLLRLRREVSCRIHCTHCVAHCAVVESRVPVQEAGDRLRHRQPRQQAVHVRPGAVPE